MDFGIPYIFEGVLHKEINTSQFSLCVRMLSLRSKKSLSQAQIGLPKGFHSNFLMNIPTPFRWESPWESSSTLTSVYSIKEIKKKCY